MTFLRSEVNNNEIPKATKRFAEHSRWVLGWSWCNPDVVPTSLNQAYTGRTVTTLRRTGIPKIDKVIADIKRDDRKLNRIHRNQEELKQLKDSLYTKSKPQ